MSSAAKTLGKTAPTLAEADDSGNAGITLFPCPFGNDWRMLDGSGTYELRRCHRQMLSEVLAALILAMIFLGETLRIEKGIALLSFLSPGLLWPPPRIRARRNHRRPAEKGLFAPA